MNQFNYVARDRTGSLTRGMHTAESPEGLQSLLEGTGLSLVSFTMQSNLTAATASNPLGFVALWRRPSSRAIELALKQMAMMLRSGLDLRACLQTVLEQTSSFALASNLRAIMRGIENGQSLQNAMAATRVFPDIVVQLVGVGENTGNLSSVLQRAAEHLAQRRHSRSTQCAWLWHIPRLSQWLP